MGHKFNRDVLIAVVIAVVIGISALGYIQYSNSNNGNTSSQVSQSSTVTNYSCTNSEDVPQGYCRGLMTYADLNSIVSSPNAQVSSNGHGLITISTGYGACILNYDILPNGTLVNWYMGATSSTQTCV